MEALLSTLAGFPPLGVYTLLGLGAALENIVPPIPADTFVLLGGFLAGSTPLRAWPVFFATWGSNVATALAVYGLGYRYGRAFFEEGVGRKVLTERQLARMTRFYARWGTPAVFLARFLPGLRAVVPAFAGVSRNRFLPVAIPIVVASAIWYGALVWLGATAGRNLDTIVGWLAGTNQVLVVIAVAVSILVGSIWWRSRKES